MEGQEVKRAWDSDLNIVHLHPQPAFDLLPPEVVNPELIPDDVAKLCNRIWNKGTFPPYNIVIRRYMNVGVAGQGLIFQAGDLGIYQASISQHTEYDLSVGLDELNLARATDELIRIDDPCVLCVKPGGDNYGHWLNEMLPRAMYARDLNLSGMKYVVPAAVPALDRVIVSSLRLLDIPAEDIVRASRPIWARELYGVNGLTAHGLFMSPRVLDCLNQIRSRLPSENVKRIYVTRQGRARQFQNEEAACRMFLNHGFRIVDPAQLSFEEQVSVFSGAQHVIGCMGAGMTNIAFAPPTATVTTFAPDTMADTFFWFLAALRGQTYKEIRCPVIPSKRAGSAWDYDIDLTPAQVRRFLPAGIKRRWFNFGASRHLAEI